MADIKGPRLYGSFKVSDPLRWDILDALKLLACFVKYFGSSINFTGSESGGPYEKAKLHAGCSAGVEQWY